MPDQANRVNSWKMNVPVRVFAYFVIFLFLIAWSAYAGQEQCLVVENDIGKRLFNCPLENGDQFAIRFTHSVALTPVTDYYKIENGKIFLDKTVYKDFGAGLPHAPEDGQKMTTENGEIVISGFNRELPVFEVRVGRVANHELLLFDDASQGKDKKVTALPLVDLAKPGMALRFSLSNDCPR